AKGHPIGTTGIGQIYEVVNQLRGEAKEPERQVKGAEVALAHNVGGSGGTACVHILKI
ncbi:3-ketoacyl-CoA thiolase, partial [Chloroflexota bacterium]